jgi:hypothetical protein
LWTLLPNPSTLNEGSNDRNFIATGNDADKVTFNAERGHIAIEGIGVKDAPTGIAQSGRPINDKLPTP